MNNKESNTWELSRRQFVKLALIGGAISQIPFISACEQELTSQDIKVKIDNLEYHIELKSIQDVQKILFPKDELGPGALELKSDLYLIWVLNDQLLDPWDGEFIIKGFRKLDKSANKEFGMNFIKLSQKQQENLIARISVIDWGRDWLSKILTLIFESMFANPNYGSNPDSIGWKWLHHQAGFPQPTQEQIYPGILETLENRYKS